MVVIAGAPGARERASGFVLHHQARTIDTQLAVYREITCDQAVLTDPATAPAEIARVLRNARERSLAGLYRAAARHGRRRRSRRCRCCRARPADPEALAECADEILAKLARPRSPAIIVDVEIRRYGLEERVAALARKLGVPVVTTFMGRGLLADAPDVLQRHLSRRRRRPAITAAGRGGRHAAAARRDPLRHQFRAVAAPARPAPHHPRARPRRCASAITSIPICRSMTWSTRCARAPRRARQARRAASGRRSPTRAGCAADDQPIAPSDIACAINDLFDRHGTMPMTSDIGDCLFTAMEIENTALAAPGYYAGMGFGVPAGIGVAAATGLRPLILVGDGAFQMTGWELGNCRRYGLDPIVVLFNNCELGNAAGVPAGIALQRSRRLEFCGDGAVARRAWRARDNAARAWQPRSSARCSGAASSRWSR